MCLCCGLRLFRRRRSDPETTSDPQDLDKPTSAKGGEFSIFGTNHRSRGAIRKLVHGTAFASPKPAAWRRPPLPTDFSTASSSFQNPLASASMNDDMHNIIEDLYNQLRGNDQELSNAKFKAFLRDVQGEDATPLDQASYTLGDFRYTWAMLYSRALRSPRQKDLSMPLTNYFISSSHNTYAASNQVATRSSPDEYRNVLMRGCRCVEIDVWNPVIPTSSSKSDHQRSSSRISGNSLPYLSKEVVNTVDDMNETRKSYMAGSKGDKSPSHPSTPNLGPTTVREDVSPRSSTLLASEPKESTDRLDVTGTPKTRARSRSRSKIPPGEPIVTHGWTLTVPCGFREVCVAIRESAFVNNDLPIIVSLEVHADAERQEIMVNIMKEEWSGLLLEKSAEGCDPRFRVPKLEDMRRKILIKVKKVPKKIIGSSLLNISASASAIATDDEMSDTDDDKSTHTANRALPPPPSASKLEVQQQQPSQIPEFPICQNLSDLAIYTYSEKFKGFNTPQAKKPPHIFSVSEDKIRDINDKSHQDLFMHNKSYFMRVFPAGRRVGSSNPDPSICWSKGVQMVAMNWQYICDKMMLHEAMFADEKGWVPKPPGYLSLDKGSLTQDDAAPGKTLDLTITIFAGQNIPVHDGDSDEDGGRAATDLRPFVKADLVVERADDHKKHAHMQTYAIRHSTGTGRSNHPKFGAHGTTLHYHNVSKVVEELSFLRLKVEDDGIVKGTLLAWACIRLDRLRQGYRLVTLRDTKGTPVESAKLLVKIEKKFK